MELPRYLFRVPLKNPRNDMVKLENKTVSIEEFNKLFE